MRWEFKIEQGGIDVVAGSAPTLQEAMREVGHYAMQYSQDGPIKLTIEPAAALADPFAGQRESDQPRTVALHTTTNT